MTDRIDDLDHAKKLEEEARLLEDEAHRLEEVAHQMEDRAHRLEHEAHEIEDGHHPAHGDGPGHGDHPGDGGYHGHGHSHDGKVRITVVVNGEPTEVNAEPNERLAAVRETALEQTNNVGQPPDKWELKDAGGTLLDVERTVGSYDFGHEVTLFLSLEAGVAGV